MKIQSVVPNNRRRAFEVHTRRETFVFPYSETTPVPSSDDRIEEVYVDPELGREGFTYRLASGAEGSVHLDSVLEYNEDPSYMAELTLYRLTLEAKQRFESSGLSAREVARLLGTSPTQLYRLLDPTNYGKSVKQLVALLYLLGAEVEVEVKNRTHRRAS
ncbi:MAG: hypothetical protein ACRDYE_12810 [Acidimicrobiales bacterium]